MATKRKSKPDSSSNINAASTPEKTATTLLNAESGAKKSTKHEFEFEFGGPVGTVFVVVGLPVVILGLFFACNKDVCFGWSKPSDTLLQSFMASLPRSWADLYSAEAAQMFLAWMALQVLLERILPGEAVEGVALANGKRLWYTMSGHLQFWLSFVVLAFCYPMLTQLEGTWVLSDIGRFPLEKIYDNYVQLSFCAIVFSFVLSIYLYVKSFAPGALLAEGGNSGYVTYDFFLGRELNPRIGSLDLKEFCELRPGLIGWAVINLGMLCKQRAALGHVSLSMLLVALSQGQYVWDALYQEKAILTTMDITTDGFGFMLAFGDLAWVPFIYSLQCRYLVDRDPQLTLAQCALCMAVQFIGYFIFRSANSQKDAFRKDPNSSEVAHLTFLQTKRGTKLITSGWWGAARKINYTGDWLITLSWCLLCGFDSPVPYFQAVYFLVLLVHRAMRDDQACAKKYGDDWLEYKRRVPYMFVPGVI